MSYQGRVQRVESLRAGAAALRVAGRATVFASFARSCYVEAPAGIACLGAGIGRGPLNMVVEDFSAPPVGSIVDIKISGTMPWKPLPAGPARALPGIDIPASIATQARSFLAWLEGERLPDDSLIGLGPGLTPAGDDFVGGAMIALRALGHAEAAERVAAWALPLAEANTNRISRAHLACAAQGEGHEALHDLLTFRDAERDLARLARIGHTSGLDAAAGAVHALGRARRAGAHPRNL